jgi:hypothetical protein
MALDRPSLAQGQANGATGAKDPPAKSMIPPARPKPDLTSKKPEPSRRGGILVETWFETDQQKYYHRDDPSTWPTAVHNFATLLKAELDKFRDYEANRLEWELEDIWDYVEGRLEAISESQPELSSLDEHNLTLAFIEEYLGENLEGLAIDENGAYFMMFRENNPDAGEWLPTSISVYSPAPGDSVYSSPENYFFDYNGRPTSQKRPMPNHSQRYDAAREAWDHGNYGD